MHSLSVDCAVVVALVNVRAVELCNGFPVEG